MSEFEFEFVEFSRHFQNSYSPNIREFEYEFELGEFFPTPTHVTPYNIFYNTTSTSPTHFHPFGQWGYVTNTNPHKSTLAPRALLRRYLMSPNPNHYDVLDPVTSHINMCRSSEFHPINKQTANANRATIPQAVPRTIKQALRLPDAAHWMNAHDK
jgi:hypothetical protein